MKQILDGCTAAAHVAYALSDIATVYPITPIASMGETAQLWAMQGRKNLFGSTMKVVEMESELGAAGATHGALSGGALATTFTASQGLLLMIPNMYKIAGELLPAVFHVGCRSLASHALSIFGDHQDVMACRATGFSFLVSNSVQETMDLALVAHLSAIDGSLPVVHMFDGWRTSNEMSTVEMIDYSDMAKLVDFSKVAAFRARGMNPEHPQIRGTAQNPDVYFQNCEARNRFYDAFPAIVQKNMDRVGNLTGRHYHLVDYAGDPEAERVMVVMGSAAEVTQETCGWLNSQPGGYRTGVVKVRLFRPFPAKELAEAIPQSARFVAVMDRTKEAGAQGEPLYQDVVTALFNAGRTGVKVSGGRYGLGSKDFSPAMVKAVFDQLPSMQPGKQFTVGINDDVTHLSVPVGPDLLTEPKSMRQYQFYGIGADGTVGATKQAAKILSKLSGLYVQAYFDYSAKKSGGYTVSSLRVDSAPVTAEYTIRQADCVVCNRAAYVKRFPMADVLKPGGSFVVNTPWTLTDMEREFPARLKRQLASKGIRLYAVDAASLAQANGLGVRINTIMETAFLKLCGEVDFNEALAELKQLVSETYAHEGGEVVNRNLAAIDAATAAIREIEVPAAWTDAVDAPVGAEDAAVPDFIRNVARPCLRREGDILPVSLMSADGFTPMGTTAWEKRSIATNVPEWNPDNCVQCTLCSLVCAHAAIRPVIMSATEAAKAPSEVTSAAIKGAGTASGDRWRIQVWSQDCVGCGSCATICPGHALTMKPLASQTPAQIPALKWVKGNVAPKPEIFPRFSVKGSQLQQPLLEFSGACGGCGETPYVKLLTQLFGERMVIANATGCSSIWGADFPSMSYCTNRAGKGPAWGNSLFEDNAEYGLGIALGIEQRRQRLAGIVESLAAANPGSPLADAAKAWLAAMDSADGSVKAAETLRPLLKGTEAEGMEDLLVKPSVWAIGGDGWAYDIGFAGLDHVIAQNTDINLLVMDTQCYSNTGGQESKATPLGAVVKYAPQGKRTVQKDLGRMAMTYGHVYVASISLGANPAKAIEVLREAEAWPGPSLVIAYCPCINHGIRTGMSHAIVEERLAVSTGYWPTWHFNPAGNPQLTVDNATPDGKMTGFLNGENRYADLAMVAPSDAPALEQRLESRAKSVYDILEKESSSS